MDPLNCYKTYLAIKNHFTQEKYDFHKYCGKVKANIQSFYKRRDRFWFEKLSRNKTDEEILNFFVANFVSCNDPQTLWIGEIIQNGESNYKNWQRKIQSLTYTFKEEVNSVSTNKTFINLFKIEDKKHPLILKEYLQGNISLETLIILNQILEFKKVFDSKLSDPVWQFVSMRIGKYSPFIHIDRTKYKNLLKESICEFL